MKKVELTQLSDKELYERADHLKQLIKIHQDYLKCSFGTFLGPMGANAEIHRCKKELQKVYDEMDIRDLLF